MADKVPIHISRELYEEIMKRVEASEGQFKSVEDYVEFVMKEIVAEDEKRTYTPEEEEEIKKRLKGLGYI
jgi:hypothetical protein